MGGTDPVQNIQVDLINFAQSMHSIQNVQSFADTYIELLYVFCVCIYIEKNLQTSLNVDLLAFIFIIHTI